jgi:DNA-binding transcriptional MerR regulator
VEVTWTITELAERAAELLAASPAQANGRVRDVPNERLIRWYVTVGLVDPPLSRKGRVARYGQRHLLQLLAVKRRQAEGRTLAEIQQELTGATDKALAAAAGGPGPGAAPDTAAPAAPGTAPAPAPAPGAAAAASATAPSAPDRFWARPPRPPDPPAPDRPAPGPPQPEPPAPAPPAPAAGDRPANGHLGLVHGIRLAPGVVLLLEDADRAPGAADATEIRNAAQPLLRALADRGLSAPDPVRPPRPEPGAQSGPNPGPNPGAETRAQPGAEPGPQPGPEPEAEGA